MLAAAFLLSAVVSFPPGSDAWERTVFPKILGDGLVELGGLVLELEPGGSLRVDASGVATQCSHRVGRVRLGPRQGAARPRRETARAAVTLCGATVTGAVWTPDGKELFVEPRDESTGEHVLYTRRSKFDRSKRSAPMSTPDSEYWIYNLTGDVMDVEDGGEEIDFDPEIINIGRGEGESEGTEVPFYERVPELWRHKHIGDHDDDGYFYDSAWTPNIFLVRNTSSSSASPSGTKWLELAVAVDHTLVSFHGRDKIERYVLSLMNIVSAIYQDSSLGADLKLAVTRLITYGHRRQTVVRPGNAKRSLENVNMWNRRLLASAGGRRRRHDVAVWLTRSDIGGPSGYAPVAGVCNPKRSCALIRDEGLTSAFIIAHEVAHILGLSHDGDKRNNNTCKQEALEGSIMAPMVSATFNKFFWSECSKKEFRKNSEKWTCLRDERPPSDSIVLNVSLQTSFTMDEQCRMEFGNGYSMCRAFEIIEPCSHLWCGHEKTPLVCKTKKGPPLEGTECGFGKWCLKGYCSDINRRTSEVIPIALNPQDGAWGEWSPWGGCSRTCGPGVRFRSRRCDNPPPLYGGGHCVGEPEEWEICQVPDCPELSEDFRSQQCKRLPKMLHLNGTLTWLPHESDDEEKKCKLTCYNVEKKVVYETKEDVIDGTPCSYDDPDSICVQGKCFEVGCNGKIPREMARDNCGVCGGNDSECSRVKRARYKTLRRENSRVAVLPKMARNFTIKLNVSLPMDEVHSSIAIVVKNRKKNKYTVTMPGGKIQHKIVDGTKFYHQRSGSEFRVWAMGPLHYETVFLMVLPKVLLQYNLNLSTEVNYAIHRDHLNPSKRFSWILGGWGPCSASCGGGKRQKTTACWDSVNDKLVKKSYCSLLQKPRLEVEKCNVFDCDFQWVVGDWEPCSAFCGNEGVQSREIYCIPSADIAGIVDKSNTTIMRKVWSHMVPPTRCSGERPSTVRPCNRQLCVSHWTVGKWSKCSASCGHGLQTRNVSCEPPSEETVFSCYENPPKRSRPCQGLHGKHDCKRPTGDSSVFCNLEVLSRYCTFNGFKRLCGKSCQASQ